MPLGSDESTAAAEADGLSGDADMCEQLKGVLFLLFAEDLQEKELREVTHFLLSDNERVVAATTFSASAVRGEAKVDEALAGWHYDMAVKNSMLDLLLGVLLNSTLPPASSAAPLPSVTSPPPKGKAATKTSSSLPPPAAAAAANASIPTPTPTVTATSQSSNESLFTSLLQPSFLIALLAHLQSSYDRILSLLAHSHTTSSDAVTARVDVNLPLRSVLYTLKLLITLTLRYPAYLQAMNQEMVWLALRDVLASPPIKEALAADGAVSTKVVVSPFSGLISGSGNVWGLLVCLLLGREVDGHVVQLPTTRGSSPVRTLVNEDGELANALTSVYNQFKADSRYRLRLHARDVLPLLLSMASTHSRFLVSTASAPTSPPASSLLRHLADFVGVLVRDCDEARHYAAHSNGVLMEQFAIALLEHEQAITPRIDVVQSAGENEDAAIGGAAEEQNGVVVEKAEVAVASNTVSDPPATEQDEQVKHSNGIHVEVHQADLSSLQAEQQQKQLEVPVTEHLVADEQQTTEMTVEPAAASPHTTEAAQQPQPTNESHKRASDQQEENQLNSDESTPYETVNGHTSIEQQAQKEQPSPLHDTEQDIHDHADNGADKREALADLPSTPAKFGATDAQSSEPSSHTHTPLTPSPTLGSQLVSDHSPFSSTAISDLEDSSASIADDELSFSHSGLDEHPGHRRGGGGMGSLAEELMEAGEEEEREEEEEAMRRYQEYEEEQRRMALMEAERQAAEERRLQQEREAAERRARIEEESRQRQIVAQREAEERMAREEEEERQRLQRLEEEAEAEVAAEAALEEEEERKEREAQLERKRAQLEQERAAEEEKRRKLQVTEAEKKRLEMEVSHAVSPLSFDDATSLSVFGFLSQLLLLSLGSSRPHHDSGMASDLPVLHTRLDSGVEDYVVKTPHPSYTSDGRAFAFSLLFDMLHFPMPPPIAAWLSASAPVVHNQYCSQLLRVITQQLLASSDSFSSLVLSSATFSHNFAQVLYIVLNAVRSGEWRGEGVQLILRLLGGWLRTPRFLSLLSAASAPPSQGKKVPDDGRRSAKVMLAVVHSIVLVQYAAALGLLARFVHPLGTTAASSLSRRGARSMELLEWCSDYLAQHKEPVLSVLMAREKHHAMVACLLYCLFTALSEEERASVPDGFCSSECSAIVIGSFHPVHRLTIVGQTVVHVFFRRAVHSLPAPPAARTQHRPVVAAAWRRTELPSVATGQLRSARTIAQSDPGSQHGGMEGNARAARAAPKDRAR